MSNSNTPLIPLSEHIAKIRALAPWLSESETTDFMRDYKSYTAIYETPDGNEWAPVSVSFYVKDRITKECNKRIHATIRQARNAANSGNEVTCFSAGELDMLLGFVTLHAPELLQDTYTDDNENK